MTQSPSPKKWKLALLTWICIYPVLNICTYVLHPYIGTLPQLVRTFLLTILVVPTMIFSMGLLQQKFFHWLRR